MKRVWNLFYGFLSILAVLMLMLPFYSMFFPAFFLTLPVGGLLMAGLYLVGYTCGKLFRFRKKTAGYDFSFSGDGSEKPALRNCALPGLLSIVLTVVLMFPVTDYLRTLPNYDRYSFLTVEAALLIAGALLCGVITSVRPFYQIVGFRTLIAQLAVFLAYAVICAGTGQATRVTVGCLLVWIVCAAVLFNQTYIIKLMNGARIGEVKSRSRLYNLAMLLGLLLCTAVLTGIIALVGNGLYFLGKWLLYLILYSTLNRQAVEEEVVPDDPLSRGELFGDGLFEDAALNESSLWLLIFIFILLLLAVIFGRKLRLGEKLRRFFSALLNGVLSLLSFLFTALGIFKGAWWDENDDGKLPEDYKDVEGKQEPGAIYDSAPLPRHRSYRSFRLALAGKKTEREKLEYSYRTLIGCFREQPMGLFPGDTPREICRKVTEKLSFAEAEAITEAFEAIRYGENTAEKGDYPEMTRKICQLIRKYSVE